MGHALALLKNLVSALISSSAPGPLCRMHQARFAASVTLIAALLWFSTPRVEAAGNHLDYTFSVDGKVTTDYSGNLMDLATAVAVQADGKIVVVGWTYYPGNDSRNVLVFRYNANGTLDTSFSGDGKVVTDLGYGSEAKAVVLQGDGKIVVVGSYAANYPDIASIAVIRYHTNGSLDTSFDRYGWVLIGFPSHGSGVGEAVALQSNGKIIVAGKNSFESGHSGFAIARLNTDGSLDTSFSGDGKVETSVGSGNNRAYGVIAQPDGKIVAGGETSLGGNQGNFALVRYNADGSLDTTFDFDGIITTDFDGRHDEAYTLRRSSDGKLVLAGISRLTGSSPGNIAIARYNTNGSLDTTFDGDGKVVTDLIASSTEHVKDLALSLTGEVVVACEALNAFPYAGGTFTLLRYRSDGQLDDTFGSGGRLNTIFGNKSARAMGVALMPLDGKIVAVGSHGSAGAVGGDIAVARYNREGIAARSDFDEDGRADFAVFRPAEGTWYVLNSSTGLVEFFQWGTASSILVPGDYDGDGKTDAAVYRPASPPGWWHIRRSSDQTLLMMLSGTTGDIPVQGDYDGDSRTDIGIFRPSTGYWYLYQSTFGNYTYANFGQATDKLVQADYDGDGLTDVALFRPSNGTWYVKRSTLGFLATQFGTSGDIPVPADYDGDGRADLTVFRPSDATWYILNTFDNSLSATQWGVGTDIPAPADFDADGRTDLTTFRPSDGYWYVLQSSDSSLLAVPFGQDGDVPISSTYTPQ